jgi:light-regulated signal transduction histidine kinase (bacteriophytochrome)
MHRENGRLKKGAFEKTSSLTIGNKIWSMEFKSSPRFGTNALDSLELFGLIGGIVISISLGALLFILQTDNRKSLARSNQRLEAELMERQKAEEKLVEIEQFAYIASHDLQEPLRTVSNYVNLLKDGFTEKLTSNDKRILSTIESATERMQILIRDLLEYSRISMEQNRQPVNLNFMLSDIQNDLEAMITEAKARFDVGELPTIMAYSSGIKSVFQNLIQNAIKFRKADVTPLIRIRCVEKEHEYRFSVSDNGIGIDSVHYGKIFVLFKRLFHVSEYPGTGIGLAQVKKIVELHGGRIWLESELGKGTTFFFDIPKSKT